MSFELVAGAIVIIGFSKAVTIQENQSGALTLNINSLGAKNFTPHNFSDWGYNGETSWKFYSVFSSNDNVVELVVYNGSKYQAITNITTASGTYQD